MSSSSDPSDKIFDIVSMACSNQPMTVTRHVSYKKISKGNIDVLFLSSSKHHVIIDRRPHDKHCIFSNVDHADANMSKSL